MSDTPPSAAGTLVRSELQLCSSPVSPSRVVPDCVVSSISDPVRQRAILLDLLCHSRLLAVNYGRGSLKAALCSIATLVQLGI